MNIFGKVFFGIAALAAVAVIADALDKKSTNADEFISVSNDDDDDGNEYVSVQADVIAEEIAREEEE